MDFERQLQGLANHYRDQGFQVIVRPQPGDLPPFARDFKVEVLAARGHERVLVSVKRNRNEAAADPHLTRYAEVANAQDGWRFDLAILEAEDPGIREIGEAREFSPEEIAEAFEKALEMARLGFDQPALVMAWSGFEAAMRQSLRAAGESTGWGTPLRSMVRELYLSGMLDVEEFRRLEALSRVRNQIVHGNSSASTPDRGAVRFLCDLGQRLVEAPRSVAVTT